MDLISIRRGELRFQWKDSGHRQWKAHRGRYPRTFKDLPITDGLWWTEIVVGVVMVGSGESAGVVVT